MLMPNCLGMLLISSLMADGSLETFGRFKNGAALFEHAHAEGEVYAHFVGLVSKLGKVPAHATFEKETGYKFAEAVEPPQFYWEKLQDRHVHRGLQVSSEFAADLLKQQKPRDALAVLAKGLEKLRTDVVTHPIMDFKNASDTIMKLLAKKVSGDVSAVEFGWPTLDEMSSGMTAGDVISFVGRPGSGKTYMMLQSALHVWRMQKRPVMFLSLEMSPEQIALRLAGMAASIPFDWIKTGGIPTHPINKREEFKAILDSFKDDEGSLHILDANSAGSAGEIEALCMRFKPAAVFVDAAYMLSVEGRYSKWERVGEACKELKKLAVRQNIPVVASWQLNRESTKAGLVGLQHIAGSDEISQISSVVLGLFEDESNISNAMRRKVNVLKGRHGEQGSFFTHWCFQTMNFSEAEDNHIMDVF